METKTYKVQMVKQIKVTRNGQDYICRWDNVKKVLMFQNNSHNTEMCLDDFLDRLNKTVSACKEQKIPIEITEVAINSLWK